MLFMKDDIYPLSVKRVFYFYSVEKQFHFENNLYLRKTRASNQANMVTPFAYSFFFLIVRRRHFHYIFPNSLKMFLDIHKTTVYPCRYMKLFFYNFLINDTYPSAYVTSNKDQMTSFKRNIHHYDCIEKKT